MNRGFVASHLSARAIPKERPVVSHPTVIFRTRRSSFGELHFKPELSNRMQFPG